MLPRYHRGLLEEKDLPSRVIPTMRASSLSDAPRSYGVPDLGRSTPVPWGGLAVLSATIIVTTSTNIMQFIALIAMSTSHQVS